MEKAYFDRICKLVAEMIPVKWTKVVLYAEAKQQRADSTFYFYLEDGTVHWVKNIDSEFFESYQRLHGKWKELNEAIHELWKSATENDETMWEVLAMELIPEKICSAEYGNILQVANHALDRGMLWAYQKYGVVIRERDKIYIRRYLEELEEPIPEDLYCREKSIYLSPDGEKYDLRTIETLAKYIERYNILTGLEREKDLVRVIQWMQSCVKYPYSKKFLQALVLLELAYENRDNYRDAWRESAIASMFWGDKEIARELACFAAKQSCRSDVANSHYEFAILMKQDKDENVADIIGMVIDELSAQKPLEGAELEAILSDFAEPVLQWRALEVPKYAKNGSYQVIEPILELCMRHKAYVTALRLSGLLYISDISKKKWEKLGYTMMLTGRIAYELGFMEVAKQCFLFAEKDTDGACFEGQDDKYRVLLDTKTELEFTQELKDGKQYVQDLFASDSVYAFSIDEYDEILDGKIKVPPYGLKGSDFYYPDKKYASARNKYNKKAMKEYDAHANGTPQERIDAIQKAFGLLVEEPEAYECGRVLYMELAKIYIEQEDYDKAREYLKKAYNSKEGKCSAAVLLGFYEVCNAQKQTTEAAAFLFRAYVLAGKDFVLEHVGVGAWELIKKYIP